MKIREYIILLTDKKEKELIKKANSLGIDDDLSVLQDYISKWLSGDDDKRLSHVEK